MPAPSAARRAGANASGGPSSFCTQDGDACVMMASAAAVFATSSPATRSACAPTPCRDTQLPGCAPRHGGCWGDCRSRLCGLRADRREDLPARRGLPRRRRPLPRGQRLLRRGRHRPARRWQRRLAQGSTPQIPMGTACADPEGDVCHKDALDVRQLVGVSPPAAVRATGRLSARRLGVPRGLGSPARRAHTNGDCCNGEPRAGPERAAPLPRELREHAAACAPRPRTAVTARPACSSRARRSAPAAAAWAAAAAAAAAPARSTVRCAARTATAATRTATSSTRSAVVPSWRGGPVHLLHAAILSYARTRASPC